jgi:phage baseplate assembly protein W
MSVDFGEDFNSPLDGYFGTVSGRQLLLQDIQYRLSQDPGNEIIDDENYGIDVRKLVNESFSPGQLVELAARVQLEVRKDDRVEACTVSARLGADRKLYLDISVTDADGPFPLTLSVDQVSVTQIVRQ